MNTRNKNKCPIYGFPKELPKKQLPTTSDVMQAFHFISINAKSKCKISSIVSKLAKEIQKVWISASIPTIAERTIEKRILLLNSKLSQVKKLKIASKSLQIGRLRDNGKFLFDVASCQCSLNNLCNCPRDRKVPKEEVSFLLDQRGDRKQFIGSIDEFLTEKRWKNLQRQTRLSQSSPVQSFEEIISEETSEDEDKSQDRSDEWALGKSISLERNYTPLPNVAKICDRFHVSNTCGAAIATATLQDYGLITSTEKKHVIDRSKIWREREKYRKQIKESVAEEFPVALFFDGRKDDSMALTNGRRIIKSEEHITILEEPESKYVGHVTPESSTAKSIFEEMINYFNESGISLDGLSVLGCDGTAVNTGKHGGILQKFEAYLGRPLLRSICLLHINELPLRHLFVAVDGQTYGPRSFSGEIGKKIGKCNSLKIVVFERIECNLPEMDLTSLSKDQQYLYKAVHAINEGHFSDQLSVMEPGPLSHSRWLTLANRILRLYVSTQNCSEGLKVLVKYVMQVYAPTWFKVRKSPGLINGSKHFHSLVLASQQLDEKYRLIVQRCLSMNAYSAHSENILLAMIFDEREHVNENVLKLLKKANNHNSSTIRKFSLPQLNFQAENYFDLIDFEEGLSMPPCLSNTDFSNASIHELRSTCSFLRHVPCHSQSVERIVKIVTSASASVCGQERRDGFIRCALKSHSEMSHFSSKQDWN